VAIVLVALALRVALVLATPHFAPREDSVVYDSGAVSLANTGHFFPGSLPTLHRGATAFYPPLFQLALAGVYKIVGTGSTHTRWEAGRLFEALLGAAVVLLVYMIAARLWRPRMALVAAGLAAVSPPLVMVGSSSLLSESLFIPLVLAAALAALHFREDPRMRWAAAAGVLIGAAALTRANGVFLVIPVGLLVWVKRPRFSPRGLSPPLAMLAATIVVLVPWTIRNAQAFHRFVPLDTGTGYTLDGTFNATVQTKEHRFPAMWVMPQAHVQQLYAADPHSNEASVSAHLTSEALGYIGAHPGSVLKTLYWNTVRMLDLTPSVERFFAPYEVYPIWLAMLSVYSFWALIPLCIAGAFFRDARAAPRPFWGMPLALYLSGVLVLGLTRGRSPLDPFLLMLAAIALDRIYEAIRARTAMRSRKSGAHGRSATPARSVSATSARPALSE
jgi:4-amino-4-deoxy-L-arabinose transferase-like glycosyltransferase